MPAIRPFHGLRYCEPSLDGLRSRIAPPYDVISRAKRDELLQRDPHNIIRLILGNPHTLTEKERRDSTRYDRAANLLREWMTEGVLAKDAEPALYLMEDTFKWRGAPLSRIGILCTVRLEELGTGQILPHEKTLAIAIEDRLKLMTATKTHTSPIYMVFDDTQKQVQNLLASLMSNPPTNDFSSVDEEIHHRMWAVTDPSSRQELITLLSPLSFLIADGHHRYTTAYHYARNEGKGSKEAQWMLAYASPSPSPGLVLSAIHRAFQTDVRLEDLLQRLSAEATVESIDESWTSFEANGAPLALLDPAHSKLHCLTPNPASLSNIDPDLRSVPSVILNDWIVKPHLYLDFSQAQDQEHVRYVKQPDELLEQDDKSELRFWLKPMAINDVIRVAEAGHVLPQKSTFFYPKVMSGFVMHSLVD